MVAHFLQSVSSQLVLGGELVYHRGRAEEGGILTLAGQYSGDSGKKYEDNVILMHTGAILWCQAL